MLLFGSPKETLDTPRLVDTPSFCFIIVTAARVVAALVSSEDTVIVSGSTIMSFLSMPYSAALFTILCAILNLPSAVSGIPSSSIVRATTTPPYFLTRGKTAFMLLALPFTEFTIGLPLYIRIAFSRATVSDVSI